MPNRRKQNAVAQPSRSASSSPASHEECSVLKGLVEDLRLRLEVLERVFFFVDFDQINKVVAAYRSQPSSDHKAGADHAFVACEWQPLHASELLSDQRAQTVPAGLPLDMRSKSLVVPEERDSGEQVCRAGPIVPVRSKRQTLQELQESTEVLSRRRDVITGLQEAADACMGFDDIQTQEASVNLVDDVELKSTCSTWDICSTRDMENEIEPELFHKFMRQALRPRWQKETDQQQTESCSPQRKACLRQAASAQHSRSSRQTTSVEHDLDEIIEAALLE
eukprot:TRINITY_DN89338_c0_g1_i1.p1 TRINITY_DN89338_c0_g1~~TRINITY_DN89338_c0_g1_i1.p1  ORF type:complete len:288 (-),score=58.60 TRINITY_DN89338_c0_g1_i1:472-1308(-)